MLSQGQLSQLYAMDLNDIPAPMLVDITQVQIDCDLPICQRLERFVSQAGNPYLFRVRDTVVRVRYGDSHTTLQERLTRLARK